MSILLSIGIDKKLEERKLNRFTTVPALSDKRKKLLLLFMVVLFIFTVIFCLPDFLFAIRYRFKYKDQGDMDYYFAGGLMLKHNVPDIYSKNNYEKLFANIPRLQDKQKMINYPPFIYCLFSPFTNIPRTKVGGFWYFLCLFSVIASVVLIFYSLFHDDRSDRYRLLRLACYIIFALLFTPTLRSLLLGQVNPILLLLLSGAFFSYMRGKQSIAGILVGIAASVKIFPAFILLFFAIRKDWKAVGASIATMLVIHVLIVLCFGMPLLTGYFQSTSTSYFHFYTDFYRPNQSPVSALGRIFQPNPYNLPWINAPHLVWPLRILSIVAVLAILIYITIRANRPHATEETHRMECTKEYVSLLFPIYIYTVFIINPLVWPHHLILLLPAIIIYIESFLALRNMDFGMFILSLLLVVVFWVIGTFDGAASSACRPVAGYIRYTFMGTLIPHFFILSGWVLLLVTSALRLGILNKSKSPV